MCVTCFFPFFKGREVFQEWVHPKLDGICLMDFVFCWMGDPKFGDVAIIKSEMHPECREYVLILSLESDHFSTKL